MNERSRGYVLMEVLVAGAIAAAVTVAAMAGMAQSLRAGRETAELQVALIDAQNIADLLRAGLPPGQVTGLYPGWQIDIQPVDRPVDPLTGAVLSLARIHHPDSLQVEIQIIYTEAGQLSVNQ